VTSDKGRLTREKAERDSSWVVELTWELKRVLNALRRKLVNRHA
jgi:hypothetical protein